jgi:hypothetical protein
MRLRHGCLFLLAATLIAGCDLGSPSWRTRAGSSSSRSSPGADAFNRASEQISVYKGQDAFGNTTEAKELAARFSILLKSMRAMAFTEGHGGPSLSEGHFITYCQLGQKSVLFLVHVPELRRFTSSARESLLDVAWMVGQETTSELRKEGKQQLGIGLRGALLFGALGIGPATADKPTTRQTGGARIDQKQFHWFFEEPTRSASTPAATAKTAPTQATPWGATMAVPTTDVSRLELRSASSSVARGHSETYGTILRVGPFGTFATADVIMGSAPERGAAGIFVKGHIPCSAQVIAQLPKAGLVLLYPTNYWPPVSTLWHTKLSKIKVGLEVEGRTSPSKPEDERAHFARGRITDVRVENGLDLIETDLPIAALGPGSALVDINGHLVGIAAIPKGATSLRYISVRHVEELLERAKPLARDLATRPSGTPVIIPPLSASR